MSPGPRRVAIIGGGIVGLATALALRESSPDAPLTVLEKESEVGRHQTGEPADALHSHATLPAALGRVAVSCRSRPRGQFSCRLRSREVPDTATRQV